MPLQQKWTTAPALAAYIGVHVDTIRDWIAGGVIRASRVQKLHYADDRPRKTDRGQWRIPVEEVDRLLSSIRAGCAPVRVPPSFWRTR